MKHKVELQRNPNPAFPKIAASIASGPPPDWLVSGLEHFSLFISEEQTPREEAKDLHKLLCQMHDATDILIKRLPLFEHLPLGMQSPDDVIIALNVLPRIKAHLDRVLSAKTSWADEHRKTCAAVVVEAWRLCRGKTQPRSERLWEACSDYWQACGRHHLIADSWRRDTIEAASRERGWITKVFSAAGYKSR
jgi:hypothetical protein